jgi:tRNA (guanine10-N2)-methyltransferase
LKSHLAANAAYIVPGNLVLDPFCGTGSLLLSAAYVGAFVVGSDIDKDCLGLMNTTNVPYKDRSKNSRFKRKMGDSEWEQLNASTPMNFDFYGLRKNLVELIDCSIEAWQFDDKIELSNYDKFDAIITDPPFGRRERALMDDKEAYNKLAATGLNGFHQDSTYVIVTLFNVAAKRLRHGGRLVFWFPTEALLTREQVREILKKYEIHAGIDACDIQFERAKQQELNFGVWRWLIVYRRANEL